MQTITQQKQKIINHLNLVPEQNLHEIDMFIRFVIQQTRYDENQISELENDIVTENDFFDVCGIWENREIDIVSLRQKAWRTQKW